MKDIKIEESETSYTIFNLKDTTKIIHIFCSDPNDLKTFKIFFLSTLRTLEQADE